MSHPSTILNELQLTRLVGCLPTYYKDAKWERLFNIHEHGCSFITFYQKTKDYDTTVLLAQDQWGWKFGGFCLEAWKCHYN